jgi:phosphate-selective porin OprO/OprP
MKLSTLTFAVMTLLSAGASRDAFAIDLYVDTKTKQIYAEPGPHREKMGSFVRVEDAPVKPEIKAAEPSEIEAIREDLELKNNAIAALQEQAKEAEETKVKLDDGIEFKSKDGNFKAAINGRMQVDSQVNVNNEVNPATGASTPNQLADGVGIRRARLGVEGTFFRDFDYKFEYDFTRGNGTVGAGVTDAFIRWNLNKPFSIKVGSFKEPFSLEEATSNRFITFIERNMAVNAFVDNPNTYKVGIGANYAQERWQFGTSLQTEPVGNNGAAASSTFGTTNPNGGSNRSGGAGDTGWEVNGRLSGMPWMDSKTKFWHIGSSGSYVSVNNNYLADGTFNNGGFSFVSNTNANVDRTSVLSTGNLTCTFNPTNPTACPTSRQVESFTRFGAETAVVYGPWSAQAEYLQTNISGAGYNGESLDGYYAYASYFLTGESRAYKSKTGAWDRLKPNRNFDMKGGWGAWELAAGYDYLNLNDGLIQGGRASTAKIGLNWYPNSHIRLMSNLIHVLDINTTQRGFNNADLDLFEMRAQVDF